MILMLMACAQTPDTRTLVDALQVVAVVGAPPEVAPGETLSVQTWLANPEGKELDLLVFACTPYREGSCVEAGEGSLPLSAFSSVVRAAPEQVTVDLPVPSALTSVLPESGITNTFFLWVLACEAGLCPIMDEVAAAPQPGSAAWLAVVERFADPRTMMTALPVEGTSLALRQLLVSQRDPQDRNVNPVLTGEVSPVVPAGTEVVVSAYGDDLLYVWPLTTAGTFEFPRYSMVGGATGMRWKVPDTPGVTTIWVVGEDGIGGGAVWSLDVLVE